MARNRWKSEPRRLSSLQTQLVGDTCSQWFIWWLLFPLLKEIPGDRKTKMPFLWGTMLSGKLQQLHDSNFVSGPHKKKNKQTIPPCISAFQLLDYPFPGGLSRFLTSRTKNKHQQRQLLIMQRLLPRPGTDAMPCGQFLPAGEAVSHYLHCGCGKLRLLAMRWSQL